MITGRQIHEARTLLKWTVSALAVRARVDEHIIRRAESVDSTPSITLHQAEALQRTLEQAGIEFLDYGQLGVRMRKAEE